MLKTIVIAATLGVSGLAQAQGAAASAMPSTPGKKELVAKMLQLQQPAIEAMARGLAEQPALQMMQQAGAALQRLPAERREAVARDIEADMRKYAEDATPLVRERAVKLAPTTIGTLLEERFTEDELKQILAMLDSPLNRKFQAAAPDMQRALAEKLVAETRGVIEPKVLALERTVKARLDGPPAAAGGLKAPAAPVKK